MASGSSLENQLETCALLPSGELEVLAVAALLTLDDALARAFASLRELSSRENVARLGRDQGYRIEDVTNVAATGLDPEHIARVRTWLTRRLPPRATVTCEAGAGPLSLRARIEPRGPEHVARRRRPGAHGRGGTATQHAERRDPRDRAASARVRLVREPGLSPAGAAPPRARRGARDRRSLRGGHGGAGLVGARSLARRRRTSTWWTSLHS